MIRGQGSGGRREGVMCSYLYSLERGTHFMYHLYVFRIGSCSFDESLICLFFESLSFTV
jgi:hypothetical protein